METTPPKHQRFFDRFTATKDRPLDFQLFVTAVVALISIFMVIRVIILALNSQN